MSEFIVIDNVDYQVDWYPNLKRATEEFKKVSEYYSSKPEDDASVWLAEVKKTGFWHADENEVPIDWVVRNAEHHFATEQEKVFDWMMGQVKEIREYGFLPCGVIGELVKGGPIVSVDVRVAWVNLSEQEKQEVLRKFLFVIT